MPKHGRMKENTLADVTFTGNLTAAPEMKFSNAGTGYAQFTVAENYRKKNKDTGQWEDSGAAFWRVTVFGFQAENVAGSFTKGTKVLVQGRAELREYVNKEGVPGKSLECVANTVGAIPRGEKQGGGNYQQQSQPQQQAPSDPWGASNQQPAFNSGDAPF